MLLRLVPYQEIPVTGNIGQSFLRLRVAVDLSSEFKLIVDGLHERQLFGEIKELKQLLEKYMLAGRLVLPENVRISAFQGNKTALNLFFLALQKTDMEHRSLVSEQNLPVGVSAGSLLYTVPYRNTGHTGDVLITHTHDEKIGYVVVGDVAGHGVEAAGFAYVARKVSATIVRLYPQLQPHEVLEKLYSVLQSIGWVIADTGMSSFGVVRTDLRAGTVSCAGGPQTPICVELRSGSIQKTLPYSPDTYALSQLRGMAATIPEYSFPLRDVRALTIVGDGMEARNSLEALHAKLRDELKGVASFYSMVHEALIGSMQDDATFVGLAFGQ